MAVNIQWNGDELKKKLLEGGKEGIARATITLHTACQKAVSKPNTGVSKRRTRDTKRGKKGSQYTVYPHPSAPGEPPRLRKGFGRANIQAKFVNDGLTGRVGIFGNAAYMVYLEFGTRRVAARPWLLATLEANKDELAKAAFAGIKEKLG
jgi:HK97 gp10 family phage protein